MLSVRKRAGASTASGGQTLYACDRWSDLEPTMECLLRQLAQRDERIGELEAELDSYRQRMELAEQYHDQAEAEIVELRRAINGVAPTDPWRFEDLDLCVALNNHADLAAVATVVRAAAMQVEARDAWTALIDSAASAAYYDACEATEGAVRALPADLLERMGVDRE